MTAQLKIAKGRKKNSSPFAAIEDVVEAFRGGEMIIVCDDEDRENEGDLTIAAEKVTPATINFMAKHGRTIRRRSGRGDERPLPPRPRHSAI